MKLRALSRENILALADMDRILESVEDIYRSKAQDKTVVWPTVFHDFKTGEKDMDIRSGYISSQGLHGLKVINWTAANPEKGLPALVGVILVFDTESGLPLGLLDGGLITGMRTGCAGAIGAKYLARKNPEKLFVLGAGNQAFYQVGAFLSVFPGLRKIYIADPVSPEGGMRFADGIASRLKKELRVDAGGVEFTAVSAEKEMAAAVGDSDMVVTVTPARKPVIQKDWVRPGTHFSCIGSDMAGKEEIDPQLFREAVVYCDDLDHAMEVGEMEIPLKEGIISPGELKGEIGQLMLGQTQGRTDDRQITIYDACGMALLDISAAKTLLDLAEKQGIGQMVEL